MWCYLQRRTQIEKNISYFFGPLTLDKYVSSMVVQSGSDWECKICGKTHRKKCVVAHHYKAEHTEFIYKCEACGNVLKSRSLLNTHRNRYCLANSSNTGHYKTNTLKCQYNNNKKYRLSTFLYCFHFPFYNFSSLEL